MNKFKSFIKSTAPTQPQDGSTAHNVVNVAVVGLSGREKGKSGVGKSCLCARFMYKLQDEYKKNDYRSEISYQDFGTKVISNEHFIYWGEREVELRVASSQNGDIYNSDNGDGGPHPPNSLPLSGDGKHHENSKKRKSPINGVSPGTPESPASRITAFLPGSREKPGGGEQ